MSLFLREATSLTHMLMERVIHFLFRKRTWQAQFEGLHEGHMHSVILVSSARLAFEGAVETTHEQADELPSLILHRNAH